MGCGCSIGSIFVHVEVGGGLPLSLSSMVKKYLVYLGHGIGMQHNRPMKCIVFVKVIPLWKLQIMAQEKFPSVQLSPRHGRCHESLGMRPDVKRLAFGQDLPVVTIVTGRGRPNVRRLAAVGGGGRRGCCHQIKIRQNEVNVPTQGVRFGHHLFHRVGFHKIVPVLKHDVFRVATARLDANVGRLSDAAQCVVIQSDDIDFTTLVVVVVIVVESVDLCGF
mmetsp:Transcript_2895/g.6172  ORF Transcript_2895/g.6172 Transcript_2895/m.6172 type:complete len:220 (+) Transcript_2895:2302-2961(+)